MSIQKIPTGVAMPLSQTSNMLYYDAPNYNGQIDMKSSYQELEMQLLDENGNVVTDTSNIVLGHDGMYYNASALFRDSYLRESRTGKTLQATNYVNILSNNLEYWTKGENNVASDALYSGQGRSDSSGRVLSVFNNEYTDTNPVLRVPLSIIHPGTLGDANLLPQSADLEFRYLLDPTYNVFMRAVNAELYSLVPEDEVLAGPSSFANNAGAVTDLTASALGTVVGDAFQVGDLVRIDATDATPAAVTFYREVVAVEVDDGATIGSITVGVATPVGAVTAVTVTRIRVTENNDLKCNDLAATGAVLTFTNPTPVNKDLFVGTTVNVQYYDANDNTANRVSRKITAMTYDGGNENIETITLDQNLVVGATALQQIYVEPLYTNLDTYDWNVLSANLVLYRRSIPMKSPENMLISTFEQKNIQMIAGLDRFMYTFKSPANGYNIYTMTPNSTNLFSQADELNNYLYTVNEKPLTTIYIPSQASSLHSENMVKTFGNSTVYKPRNLQPFRDRDINQAVTPVLFPAKLFEAKIKGETNERDFSLMDNDVKVELDAAIGQTTVAKNIYFFIETYKKI